ncbi:low-density lipoprotein receptor-related protein 4-like [Pollicipes pollicipes]|uniref:low-density lipoprotein receptor-related protein 4-like n=1 Tax=Pollicipes pollicipes TaxID=41117 RepID=UPI0018851006|nr:low-density lipoprotein receptor-related protein 4-like [Pollicipes pollicipes]
MRDVRRTHAPEPAESGGVAVLARCGPGQLQCRGDAECLDVLYRCDGVDQCEDGSDEIGCAAPASPCGADGFWCPHRAFCVGAAQLCDGVDDCGDGGDEDCDVTECAPGEMRCETMCIEADWVCDGTSDCDDGRDERNCSAPAACASDQFTCLNGLCLPAEDRCDGHQDCDAGEDEVDCEPGCPSGQFHCPEGPCLPPQQVCDGFRQCSWGQDEDGCAYLAECPPTARCEQLCLGLPSDAEPNCTCRSGYALQPDRVSCADVDECGLYRPCSHFCHNSAGSFNCSCAAGYQLRPDGVTCRAGPPPASLMLAAKHTIQQVTLNGAFSATAHRGLANAVYVDYHLSRGLLFWLDTAQNVIYRSLITGSRPWAVTPAGLFRPAGLAVDWLHDLVYWAEERPGAVEVSTLDGAHRHRLLAADLEAPRALCLHPERAFLFWADVGSPARIERVNGDGSGRRRVVSGQLAWPNALTLDQPTDTLYWADAKLNTIGCCRLDGTGRRQVLGHGVPHPFSLTLFEDTLYWTDLKTHALHAADKRHGESLRQLRVSLEHPLDVRSVHPLRQPGRSERCADNGRCSHLCLPRPDGRLCACPSGLRLLSTSRTTCQSGPPAGLLLAQNGSLQEAPLDGGTPHPVPLVAVGRPTALAADRAGALFWADGDSGSVQRSLWNGSQHRLVLDAGLGNVTSLALDWLGGLLYWTDASLQRLEVARADGQLRSLLLSDGLDSPAALVVDPPAGLMYWTDLGAPEAAGGRIERAAMDGSRRSVVLGSGLGAPTGLALDTDSRTIYWCDAKLGAVSAAPLPPEVAQSGCGRDNGGCSHLCLLAPAGRASCRCPTGVPMSEDGRSCERGPRLSLVFARGREVRRLALTDPPGVDTVLPLPRNIDVTAIAWDQRSGRLLYFDRAGGRRRIVSAVLDGLKSHPVVTHELGHVSALAIDMVGGKLFWTDMSRASVEVAELDGQRRQLLVHAGLQMPGALAVSHRHGLLFWADWGSEPRLERAGMDGSQRSVVVTGRLGRPSSIVVHALLDTIYWCDHQLGVIEWAGLDGSRRATIASGLRQPFGLAVHRVYLYWTEGGSSGAVQRRLLMSKFSAPDTLARGLDGLRHLLLVERDTPLARYACGDENGGCAGLCLRRPGGQTCRCGTGLAPTADGTCPARPSRMLLYLTLNSVVQVSLDTDERWEVTMPVTGVHNAVRLDFVHADNAVVFTDRGLNEIRWADLRTPAVAAPRTLLNVADVWPEGVAVDWAARLLFFSEARAPALIVMALSGCCRRRLVTGGLSQPRALAVLPAAGLLVWADQGAPPRLEAVRLDGSGRHRLVTEGISAPTGLAAEQDRVYWADSQLHRIESCDLQGGDRRVLVAGVAHPFGVTVMGDWLYWTDWETKTLEQAGKADGGHRSVIRGELERVMSVVAVSAERQSGSSPCAADNGGCSHLCLHTGGGEVTCACPDAPDERPCHTNPHSQGRSVDSGSPSGVTTALLTAGGLLLLLLVLLVLGLLCRARLARNAPDQEATLTFSNPTYNSSASDFSNEKRFSWRKANYNKAQEAGPAGPPGGAGGGGAAGLEAAALIDAVTLDHNSSTPLASSPGLQH